MKKNVLAVFSAIFILVLILVACFMLYKFWTKLEEISNRQSKILVILQDLHIEEIEYAEN